MFLELTMGGVIIKGKTINYKSILLYSCGAFLLSVIYTLLILNNYLPKFFYINIEYSSIRELINSLWQVQASISLLSITLVSLMISKIDTRIYGLTVKEVLSIRLNFYSLSYWDKIALSIILVICNLFYVTEGILSGVIFIFIMNALLIFIIFIETFEVITEASKYKETAKNYITNFITQKSKKDRDLEFENEIANESYRLINSLRDHSITLNKQNNIYQLRDNINFFIAILKAVSSRSIQKDDFYSIVENKFQSLIENMVESENIVEVQSTIDSIIMLTDLESRDYLILNVFETMVDSVTLIKNKHQFDKYKIHEYIDKSIINKTGNCIFMYKRELIYLFVRYYINLRKNDFINSEDKTTIIKSYLNWVTEISYKKEDSDDLFIFTEIIFCISKYMINNIDSKGFGYLVSEVFINNRLGLSDPFTSNIFKIAATLVVYLYYATYKEDYFENEYKDKIKLFINYSNSDITKDKPNLLMLTKNSDGAFWIYYTTIRNEMSNSSWEYGPLNDSKWLIMDNVIIEFFVFYSIPFVNSSNLHRLKIDKIKHEDLRLFIEYFNTDGTLKEMFRSAYTEFCKWLELDSSKGFTNKDFLIYLNVIYKQSLLNEIHEYRCMKDKITTFENETIQKIKDKFKCSIFYSDNIYDTPVEELAVSQSFLIGSMTGKIILFGEIETEILRSFEQKLYEKIKDKCVTFKYAFNETEKIKSLLKLIKKTEVEEKISIRSYINKSMSDNHFLNYYEDVNDKDELIHFEKLLNSLGNIYNENLTAYLDKNIINIKFTLSHIGFRDLTNKEVEKQISMLDTDDQYYLVNIDNIKIPFTKDEVDIYFKENFKVLEVRCKVFTEIKGICGVAIELS